jgi:hypothetical protein
MSLVGRYSVAVTAVNCRELQIMDRHQLLGGYL